MKKLLLILLCLTMCGCRYIEVELPNGNKIKYVNLIYSTKIGKMDIKDTSCETLSLENLDSDSKALDIVGKSLDKIP